MCMYVCICICIYINIFGLKCLVMFGDRNHRKFPAIRARKVGS